MARARKPMVIAKATGADLRNPSRYAGRSNPRIDDVGEPYATMSEAGKLQWQSLKSDWPWLRKSDRTQFRILSELMAQNDAGGLGFSKLNMLRIMINSFGGSPADRSKVTWDEPEESDPASRYFS